MERKKKDQAHFITCFPSIRQRSQWISIQKDIGLSSDLDFHWGFSISGSEYQGKVNGIW